MDTMESTQNTKDQEIPAVEKVNALELPGYRHVALNYYLCFFLGHIHPDQCKGLISLYHDILRLDYEAQLTRAFPYRLRDREQLRKRKLEAQEQKSSQWVFKEKSKTKRGRKGKASGTSNKLTKKPEPEPEPESRPAPEPVPCPEPQPLQEQKEEAKDKAAQLSPQWEKPAPLQESPNLSITGDPATTSTDELGEIKLACVKTPESLPLQAEDVPGGNAPFEEQVVLTM